MRAATSQESFGKFFALLWVFNFKLTTRGWKVEVKRTQHAVTWPGTGQRTAGGQMEDGRHSRAWKTADLGGSPAGSPTVPYTSARTSSHANICTHTQTQTHTHRLPQSSPRCLQLLSGGPASLVISL